MISILVPALCAASLLLTPAIQDDAGPVCKRCDSTGMSPCGEHPKAECELHDGSMYCSEFAGCTVCSGTGWIDCERCENEAAGAELERRVQERERKAKGLKWIEDEMGRSLRMAETPNVILVWELDSLKVEKKRKNAHELLHLYAGRLDTLYEDYCEALGATRRHFTKKPTVFVWWLPKDQLDASLRFCGNSNRSGVKLLGATPTYSVCGNKQFMRGDEELHRNLVHNVTHLLLSHHSPAQWIGNIKGGWADAGLAHWFEEKYWGICTNYCYQEGGGGNTDFKGGKYRVAVRKLVAAEKVPEASLVFQRNTDTLTPAEHAVAFSYVDYLLSIDGKKFYKVVQMLKQRKPVREALKAVFDMNPLQFEERWKAWVLETYPTR